MPTYKLMTLNMKNESVTSFRRRKNSLAELVREQDPDLIGVQELMDFMIAELPELFETYCFFGKARQSSDKTNERCCILYRRDRFRLIRGKTIWLSDTPDVPSKFQDSIFPRIATMAVLEDRTCGIRFTFANTHLDHLLPSARMKQVRVFKTVLEDYREGAFTAVTGDFNTTLVSKPLQDLISDRFLHVKDTAPHDGRTTIRGFIQASASRYRPIDHIFVSEEPEVIASSIHSGMVLGVYPTDHCPITTVIRVNDPEASESE
ncbi:MAG: endonuclease/exonuclease/phosphatase family protein [Solobacterium sp.]|nr:endonuclease/exonuclease/phosphatase family protein [Solobacterium sp.]